MGKGKVSKEEFFDSVPVLKITDPESRRKNPDFGEIYVPD